MNHLRLKTQFKCFTEGDATLLQCSEHLSRGFFFESIDGLCSRLYYFSKSLVFDEQVEKYIRLWDEFVPFAKGKLLTF